MGNDPEVDLPYWVYSTDDGQGESAHDLVVWHETTAPATEPVTVTELKRWGHFADEYQEEEYAEAIAVARAEIEGYLGRALITRTITAIAEVPKARLTGNVSGQVVGPRLYVRLPMPHVQKLGYATGTWKPEDHGGAAEPASVQEEDLDDPGTYTALTGTVLDTSEPDDPKLWLAAAWPSGDHLQIIYTAGYDDSRADVPLTIRNAIKRRATDLLDNRSDNTGNLNNRALAAYRLLW